MSKRTQGISASFRHRAVRRAALLGMAGTALAGCKDNAYLVTSQTDCEMNTPYNRDQCEAAYMRAVQNARLNSPVYSSRSNCEQEFGPANCEKQESSSSYVPGSAGGGYGSAAPRYRPKMTGFLMNTNASPSVGYQAYNPVFRYSGDGTEKLVTASGQEVRGGTKGQARVAGSALNRTQLPGSPVMARGGFGRIMMARAGSFGG